MTNRLSSLCVVVLLPTIHLFAGLFLRDILDEILALGICATSVTCERSRATVLVPVLVLVLALVPLLLA